MSKNNFEIINARITFKNVPIHKIEKFSFKNVATALEALRKFLMFRNV
jgi:glutamyl-tRNA reductase